MLIFFFFFFRESYYKDSWKGEIVSIEDIEENIWATNLGLKGKIDATVKVKTMNETKTKVANVYFLNFFVYPLFEIFDIICLF